MTDILLGDLLIFTTLSRRIFLRMTNVLHKSYGENQNRGFVSNNFFPPKIVQFVI